MYISVIICTYNPNLEFLGRTLASLSEQSLHNTSWELLIIDNGSAFPIKDQVNLSWHPDAKILIEPRIGLTNARICGINHSKHDILVFVDDDNLLRSDYLENAMHIAGNYPFLGAWGGSLIGDFEITPPKQLEKYLNRLAIYEVPRFIYTTEYFRFDCIPSGAGMCIRNSLAKSYVNNVLKSSLKENLGRKGSDLASCEDLDIAMDVIDQGFAVGRSPNLVLVHLIPKWRLTIEYMKRLVYGDAKSNVLLKASRGLSTSLPSPPRVSLIRRIWLAFRLSRTDFIMWTASIDGSLEGYKELERLDSKFLSNP